MSGGGNPQYGSGAQTQPRYGAFQPQNFQQNYGSSMNKPMGYPQGGMGPQGYGMQRPYGGGRTQMPQTDMGGYQTGFWSPEDQARAGMPPNSGMHPYTPPQSNPDPAKLEGGYQTGGMSPVPQAPQPPVASMGEQYTPSTDPYGGMNQPNDMPQQIPNMYTMAQNYANVAGFQMPNAQQSQPFAQNAQNAPAADPRQRPVYGRMWESRFGRNLNPTGPFIR